MLPRQLIGGHDILNGSEDCGGDDGDRDTDEEVAEVVVGEEVVVVVEMVAEEEKIMAEIVERVEQAEEADEAEILKEETVEEIVVEIVAE